MFNKSAIMKKAHQLYRSRKGKNRGKIREITWAEALHRAWESAKVHEVNKMIVADAKAKANIDEDVETKTWYGWKLEGFEVIHESECVFQARILYPENGEGETKINSYFTREQVQPLQVA